MQNEKEDTMDYLQLDKEHYYEDIFQAVKSNDKKTFRELFLRLHDRDQHEVFHLLYPEKKRKIAEFLTAEEFAEIFEWMDIEDQEAAVEYLPDDYTARVFNNLANDDVVYFITQSETTDSQALLEMMEEKESKRVQELLSYASESAGSIMTKEYITIRNDQTVSEVIEQLREFGHQAETIYYLYVIGPDDRLVGVLSLRDLLLSPENELVENIMFQQIVSIRVDQDQEEVAEIIQDYDFLAVPVLSHDGRLQGIVTVDDVMDIMEDEAREDFIEFAGISSSETDEDISSPLTAAKQRTPWIIILLFLGLFTGGLIGVFEETLESVITLAIFIPVIMATAGNIGTQSLAVAISRLSNDNNKDSFLITVRNELGSGLVIGLLVALVLTLVVLVVFQNPILAFIISVSMFLITCISTVVGTIVPVIINKFNIDPAVASGPFITTINDSLGLIIYFIVATSLIQFL